MGYLKIKNLYADPTILQSESEVYALEKIHGTSAHFAYDEDGLKVFSGGIDHKLFCSQFDLALLTAMFRARCQPGMKVIVFGEAYGGKCQGMSKVYGKDIKFVAFDVKVNDEWLPVPMAETTAAALGFEFVHYARVPATVEAVNAERDRPSEQAMRNGCGTQIGEGIVVRPIEEKKHPSGGRLIAKHKRPEFSEHRTPRELDPSKAAKNEELAKVADEWVTDMRLSHVLDKLLPGGKEPTIEDTAGVINAMVKDIAEESGLMLPKEIVRAIGRATSKLFQARLALRQ